MSGPGGGRATGYDQRVLHLLAELGVLVRADLDVGVRARLVAELAVPDLGDHAQVFLLQPDRTLRVAAVAHCDAAIDQRVAVAVFPVLDLDGPSAAAAAARSGITVVRPYQPDDGISRALQPLDAELAHALATESVVAVPLAHGAETIGALLLARAGSHAHDDDDVALARELAATAGPAIGNALRFERERSTGETLQRGLLPQQVANIEGLQVAARYVPADAGVQVGGDWYDVLECGEQGAMLVIGDVVGHGAEAAVAMGRIRTVLQLAAADEDDPAALLGRANKMLCQTFGDDMATVGVARVDPAGFAVLCSAGHVPAVVIAADGTARLGAGPTGMPLGVDADATYESVQLPLEAGAAVVLCTDGLIERRGEPIDDGLARLLAECDGQPVDDPHRLADRLLIRLLVLGGRLDDVAVLVARLVAVEDALSVVVPVEARSLGTARRHLKAWLRRDGAIDDTTVDDVVLATSEALANAVEHAYVDRTDGRITLAASRIGGVIDVRIADDGTWREDWGADNRGRGIQLMGKLVDDVDVAVGDTGTTVTLRKRA